MIKTKTTDKDLGYANVMKLFKGGKRTMLVVGVTAAQGGKRHPGKKGGKPGRAMTVADVAVVNEFGAKDVPERSFLRSTVDRNEAKYRTGMRKAVAAMIEEAIKQGKIQARHRNNAQIIQEAFDSGLIDPQKSPELKRLGLQIAGDIKRAITAGVPPPNAQSTINRKKSDTPLVDTGRLRQAISFEIRRLSKESAEE